MIDQHRDILKTNNLKITPARIAILELLQNAKTPVDANDISIYLKNKNIDANQSTIYRILTAFVQNGFVKQVAFEEGKSRYELSSLPHHHHMICTHCGDVQDIETCDMEEIEKKINKKFSFTVKHHSLEFFGLCSKCK